MDTTPVSVAEYEQLARDRLPTVVWDYLAGGSGAGQTLLANRAAYDRHALRPTALVDVSTCDPSTTLLGATLAAPVGVAPMAYHRIAHHDGELATARAAGDAGALFVVSLYASCRLEEIAAASDGPLWLQLYWLRQREIMLDLLQRAESAGYRAVVLTVDTPRVARRPGELRHGFAVPDGVAAVNIDPAVMAGVHEHRPGASAVAAHSRQQLDPTLSWRDLEWLQDRTSLPLVLKGILTADDARRAVDHDVAAIVVSNHGGRQLDGAVATLDALPDVVAAVDGRCPVLVDGGIRSGADILKALALGAGAVLVGRPVLWGLACAGTEGVRAVLDILATELEDAMVLSGRPRPADLDSTLLAPRR